jgi:hypothetical protein
MLDDLGSDPVVDAADQPVDPSPDEPAPTNAEKRAQDRPVKRSEMSPAEQKAHDNRLTAIRRRRARAREGTTHKPFLLDLPEDDMLAWVILSGSLTPIQAEDEELFRAKLTTLIEKTAKSHVRNSTQLR